MIDTFRPLTFYDSSPTSLPLLLFLFTHLLVIRFCSYLKKYVVNFDPKELRCWKYSNYFIWLHIVVYQESFSFASTVVIHTYLIACTYIAVSYIN